MTAIESLVCELSNKSAEADEQKEVIDEEASVAAPALQQDALLARSRFVVVRTMSETEENEATARTYIDSDLFTRKRSISEASALRNDEPLKSILKKTASLNANDAAKVSKEEEDDEKDQRRCQKKVSFCELVERKFYRSSDHQEGCKKGKKSILKKKKGRRRRCSFSPEDLSEKEDLEPLKDEPSVSDRPVQHIHSEEALQNLAAKMQNLWIAENKQE